jgi:hypothetical protein
MLTQVPCFPGHDAFAAMQNLFDECFNSSFPAWSAFGGSAFGGFGDPFQRMDAFARASDDLFASYPFSAGAQSCSKTHT